MNVQKNFKKIVVSTVVVSMLVASVSVVSANTATKVETVKSEKVVETTSDIQPNSIGVIKAVAIL